MDNPLCKMGSEKPGQVIMWENRNGVERVNANVSYLCLLFQRVRANRCAGKSALVNGRASMIKAMIKHGPGLPSRRRLEPLRVPHLGHGHWTLTHWVHWNLGACITWGITMTLTPRPNAGHLPSVRESKSSCVSDGRLPVQLAIKNASIDHPTSSPLTPSRVSVGLRTASSLLACCSTFQGQARP